MTTPRQAAAREPTGDMLIAARDWSAHYIGSPLGNKAAIGCWQAMFDALPLPVETTDPEDETDKPPLGDASYARQWASDTLSGRVGGGKFPWGERNLSHAFLNMLGTTNTMEISSAAYLSGAYDWRKKAERMKETLIKADATLELISTMSQSRGEGPTVRECGRLAREAIATICEALGET